MASGGTRPVTEQVLRPLGVRELFAVLVTSDKVPRQKPAPDIFPEAARRLAVPPPHCRACEDTDLGLQAIRAAGMEAVEVRQLLGRLRTDRSRVQRPKPADAEAAAPRPLAAGT